MNKEFDELFYKKGVANLQYFSYRPLFYLYSCSRGAPMFLLLLSAICSVLVRYMSAFTPNIYRTCIGHVQDMYRTCIGDVTLPFACSIGGLYQILQRYASVFPLLYVGLYIVRFTKIRILFKSRFLKQRNLPYGDSFLCFFSEISINNRRKAMLN